MLNNGNFNGKIDGKSLYDYRKLVDYKVSNIDDRLTLVYDLLSVVEEDGVEFTNDLFWRDIFDSDNGVLKTSINTTDALWSETNVALFLEQLGTYLIKSYEDTIDKLDVITYDTDKENKRHVKEIKTKHRMIDTYDEPKFSGNYKKDTKVSVKKGDENKYPLIKEYYDYKQYLRNLRDSEVKMSEMCERTGMKLNKKKIDTMIGKLNEDMLDCKIHIDRPIVFKAPLKDGGCPEWDVLDMFEPSHVLELLKVHKGNDLQDDISCIVIDLNNLIDRIEFGDKEKEILELYRKDMSLVSIADIVNISPRMVKHYVMSCVNSIIKEYEKDYMDWYYLNKVKGKYKQCSQCGEIKLIQEFDRKTGELYMSACKACRRG